jgi:predicted permease
VTDVVSALIPVFALIAIGYGARMIRLLEDDGWRAVERVTYFVLFPCFLFGNIAFADFSREPIGALSVIMAGSMIAMSVIVYPFRSLLGLAGPAFTSVFQGAVRWNSYVALGAIAAVLGPQGVSIAAIAVAIMVPLANLLCVIVLMQHKDGGRADAVMLFRQLARNPLILSCLAGVGVQMLGIPFPKEIVSTIDMPGKAALPLGLLAVGASLDLGHFRAQPGAIAIATLLKLLLMPCLMAAGSMAFGITGTAKTAVLICAAVPGASSSYILARQLGGDAPLMANITTVQTLAAMLTMPLMLWVLGS